MSQGTFRVKVEFNGLADSSDLLQRFHLEKGGLVQQVIDKSVIDWDLQYCPWETGTLAKSAYTNTEIGSGKVVYRGPYAHYLYYGEVYGPNFPIFEDNTGEPTGFRSPPKKYPTGRQLQYSTDVNPLAGSFWFERMKADHKDDILKEARSAAGVK
jgi:hypothetical protein